MMDTEASSSGYSLAVIPKEYRGTRRLKRYLQVDRRRCIPEQITPKTIRSISIGATIGTGVFIGIGTSLKQAGPAGTLIAYFISGTVVWGMIVSTSEMIAWLPNVGGLVGICSLYMDPALGFALGWLEWYNWVLVFPVELSAATVLFAPYIPSGRLDVNNFRLMVTFTLLMISMAINCLPLRGYGVFSVSMSIIKRFTIISLVVGCVLLNTLATARKEKTFFEYWNVNSGPFVKYRSTSAGGGILLGIWTAVIQASYSYYGSEISVIVAGEVRSARKNAPRSAKLVFSQVFIFYMLSAFAIGLVVRHDDCRLTSTPLSSGTPSNPTCFSPSNREGDIGRPDLSLTSPFIIAIEDYVSGTLRKLLPVILTCLFGLSAWSAGVCDVFISSRYLFFLAQCGQAPDILRRGYIEIPWLGAQKLIFPWTSLAVSFLFGALTFMSFTSAVNTFNWLSSMTSVSAIISWIIVLATYERWYRVLRLQAREKPELKDRLEERLKTNRHRFQPWLARYSLVVLLIMLVSNGWCLFGHHKIVLADEVDTTQLADGEDIAEFSPAFISSFIPLPIFIMFVLWYKLVYRSSFTPWKDMPPIEDVLDAEEEHHPT